MACCNVNTKLIVFLLSFIVVVLYIIVGALIFQAIEKPNELRNRELARVKISVLTTNVSQEFLQEMNRTEACWLTEVLSFSEEEDEKQKEGMMGDWSDTWRFWRTARFCFTVVTTIGYGDMVPVTHLGKGITMIFAVTGIPLYWMLISSYSFHLAELLKHVVTMMTKDKAKAYYVEQIVAGSTFFLLFLVLTIAMLIVESWSLGTALWFSLISITTIGFGDVHPTTGDGGTVILFVVLMTLCFVTLSVFLQTQTEHFFKLYRTAVSLSSDLCSPCCKLVDDVQPSTRLDNPEVELEVEEYDLNQD